MFESTKLVGGAMGFDSKREFLYVKSVGYIQSPIANKEPDNTAVCLEYICEMT